MKTYCIKRMRGLLLLNSSATSLSYDYFILGNPAEPVIVKARRRFWRELQRNPPDVFVVSIGPYPNDVHGIADYRKLNQWPKFSTYLRFAETHRST